MIFSYQERMLRHEMDHNCENQKCRGLYYHVHMPMSPALGSCYSNNERSD